MSHLDAAMVEALAQGREALGVSSPNPPVGAVVIAADGRIIGRGHTQPAGGPHAEVMALRQAGAAASGATLVCTLEPCAHTGRTGPCTEAIVAAGIAAVAYAVADPNAEAAGGHAKLEAAGITVTAGILQTEAEDGALRAWLFGIPHERPFVTWKVAQSLDGQIAAANGTSRWITGEQSRAEVHRLREQVDAILVGAGTVRADNPALTARDEHDRLRERQPLRIVLTNGGRLPADAAVLDGSVPTLIAVGPAVKDEAMAAFERQNVQCWRSPGDAADAIDLLALLRRLYGDGIRSLLVEGGPTVAGSFAGADLIDEVLAYVAPKLLLSGMWPALRGYGVNNIGQAIGLRISDVQRRGDDVLITAVRRAADPEGK